MFSHVDPLPGVVNTIEEKGGSVRVPGRPMEDDATNDRAGDQSEKEAGSSPVVTIEGEPGPDCDRISRELDVATYHYESGELYGEDVDQHMAVLPDIVTPTAGVAINDI